MNIVLIIIPFLVSILVVITKRKMINSQSGKKYAYREVILDGVKIIIVTIVSLIANLLYGKDIQVWSLVIDFFMMIVYLLPLLKKEYDYVERKALMGILAFLVFILVIEITLAQMIIGTYDRSDTTLAFCFVKGVCYFGISIWCCFTTGIVGKKNKIKALCNALVNSYRSYKLNMLEYYMFAIFELFIFVGKNDYFIPVGVFGLHEIINRKYLKGILFMLFGNICLFLRHEFQGWGYTAFIIYVFVAIMDMLIHFIKWHKK